MGLFRSAVTGSLLVPAACAQVDDVGPVCAGNQNSSRRPSGFPEAGDHQVGTTTSGLLFCRGHDLRHDQWEILVSVVSLRKERDARSHSFSGGEIFSNLGIPRSTRES